jgi:hypothetical protein
MWLNYFRKLRHVEPHGLLTYFPALITINDMFYSGLLRESPVRRAHDIPCWTSHTNIAWPAPPSKRTSPFRGRAGLSPRRLLPAHRGTPLMYIPRMLPHSYFPPRIYGVPRARLQPSRRRSPPSTRSTSPVFRPQVPRAGQNISSVSICASVAMVGIDKSQIHQ